MTCIVVLVSNDGTVVMGSDSGGFSDDSKEIRVEPKVFQVGQIVFGFCGNFRIGQLLQYGLSDACEKLQVIFDDEHFFKHLILEFVPKLQKLMKKHGCVKNDDGLKTMDAEIVMGLHGRAFKIENNFQISEIKYFDAIGSGSASALGALDMLYVYGSNDYCGGLTAYDAAMRALETAKKMSPYVAEPFKILEI